MAAAGVQTASSSTSVCQLLCHSMSCLLNGDLAGCAIAAMLLVPELRRSVTSGLQTVT